MSQENDQHRKVRAAIQAVQSNQQLSAREKQRRIMALVRGDLTAVDWSVPSDSATDTTRSSTIDIDEKTRLTRTPASLLAAMSEDDRAISEYGHEVDEDRGSSDDEINANATESMEHDDDVHGTIPPHRAHPLGCKHYQRGCKYLAECCQRWFGCRVCHDERVGDHKFPRRKTEFIYCMHCETVQPFAQKCGGCGVRLARYVCDVCRFHDDDSNKSIYHCDKCGICRIGRGLDDDFFHCDTCACCLAMALRDNHVCIEKALSGDCPVCGMDMSVSRAASVFMPCGHAMHQRCHSQYIRTNYVCPICSKSLHDMTLAWQQMDTVMEATQMPDEYKDAVAHVMCNDCLDRGVCAFHFNGHKCKTCGSYNTRVTRTENLPEMPVVMSHDEDVEGEE